jgi:hypothetical protein
MRRTLLLVLVAAGGQGVALASPARSPATVWCHAPDLALSFGPRRSAATGQHLVGVVFRNATRHACSLRGYPTVELVGRRGGVLPFTVVWDAGRVRRVDLRPGARAIAYVSKYRCDTTVRSVTRGLIVGSPEGGGLRRLRLTAAGVSMDFCGRGDPGSVVHVSPVAAARG